MIVRTYIEDEFLKCNLETDNPDLEIFQNGNEIEPGLLAGFEIISSIGIKLSKYRKRYISKYVVPVNYLEELINSCQGNYKLLERNGDLQTDISLKYYDTNTLKFFNDHVNGKLNRLKIRQRYCIKTGHLYWEIWRRKSTGRMIKKRFRIDGNNPATKGSVDDLVLNYTGIDLHTLSPSLGVRFKRITLLNTELYERITIDTGLCFTSPEDSEQDTPLAGLAIVELRKKRNAYSFLADLLSRSRFRPVKISKYCLGITLTNQNAKSNNYKPKIRNIVKTIMHGHFE